MSSKATGEIWITIDNWERKVIIQHRGGDLIGFTRASISSLNEDGWMDTKIIDNLSFRMGECIFVYAGEDEEEDESALFLYRIFKPEGKDLR